MVVDAAAGAAKPAPLRVGGVPEHFNYLWHMANERGIFARHGVEVEFVTIKLGTGAMIKAAKEGDVDVVIALTEGLVADIAKGSELRLLGTYVKSPLCWAISTGAGNEKVQTVEDLRKGTFGVSRMGSGSHLMAIVLADQRGWDTAEDVSFAIKGDFQALRNGVNDGSTDAFMWETFTTKPYHDSGEVRRVGDITTPWPCFMLAARKQLVSEKRSQLQAALAAVHEAASIFREEASSMPGVIAKRCVGWPATRSRNHLIVTFRCRDQPCPVLRGRPCPFVVAPSPLCGRPAPCCLVSRGHLPVSCLLLLAHPSSRVPKV